MDPLLVRLPHAAGRRAAIAAGFPDDAARPRPCCTGLLAAARGTGLPHLRPGPHPRHSLAAAASRVASARRFLHRHQTIGLHKGLGPDPVTSATDAERPPYGGA